jgi:hypothetical protein
MMDYSVLRKKIYVISGYIVMIFLMKIMKNVPVST